MNEFSTAKKLKVSPYSEYYAIEAINEEINQPPLMIVVDPRHKPYLVFSKSPLSHRTVSAVVIPDLRMINLKFCVEILNVLDGSPIELYKVPLVAEHRGSVHSNSHTIKVFNN